MSNLSAFLNPVSLYEEKEVVVSKRFQDENGNPVPFKIRSLTEDENDACQKKARRTRKVNGRMEEYQDQLAYMRSLVVGWIICMVLDYINNGITTEFSIQVTNEDPATSVGRQTIAVYGCTLTGEIPIAILDSEEAMLNYDFEFTYSSIERLQAFTEPSRYGN